MHQGGSRQQFRVNVTTALNQLDGKVDMADDGSFVVAWTSTGQDGHSDGVYANAMTTPAALTGEIRSIPTLKETSDTAILPFVRRFVCGHLGSESQDGSGRGVYAQQFDSAGNRLGGEVLVNTTTANEQFDPKRLFHGLKR